MQTDLLCDDDDCLSLAPPYAAILQPLMTYKHRVVGYEATCSVPWKDLPTGEFRQEVSAGAAVGDWHFAVQAAEAPMCYSIAGSMDAVECETLFPSGSLLFLELPHAFDGQRLINYCSALRSAGFSLGISDYRGESIWDGVFPLVTHIRFQHHRNLTLRQKQLISSSLRKTVFFVAGNLATQADLMEAMRLGFQLFQGNFACRIARLHWPEEEILARVLLLSSMCQGEEITSDLLTEFLGSTSLRDRFDNLLRHAAPNSQANTQNPEKLLAELGAERTLRYMQLSFMWDVTGSSSPVLIRGLFQTARFHELMRMAALGSASPSACFEGLMLSVLHAVEHGGLAGRKGMESISTLLRERLGTPINCSAFVKNHLIAHLYSGARWEDVEKRCGADGYTLASVNRMFHEAERWALDYTRTNE